MEEASFALQRSASANQPLLDQLRQVRVRVAHNLAVGDAVGALMVGLAGAEGKDPGRRPLAQLARHARHGVVETCVGRGKCAGVMCE